MLEGKGTRWIAGCAVLCVSLFIGAAPAYAEITNFKVAIGAGVFTREAPLPSVAVNNVTGDVYADNFETKKIIRFDSRGHVIEEWPGEYPPGESRGQAFLAVDNSTGASQGDVYVAEITEGIVLRRNPSGTPVNFTSVAPYISGSDLTGAPTGAGGAVVPFSRLGSVAVDAAGAVYVIDGEVVDVFSSEGKYQSQITGTPTGPSGEHVPFNGPNGVAIAANGTMYILDAGIVDVFTAKGEYVRQITGTLTGPAGEFVPFASASAIAVDDSPNLLDPSTGDVYVTDTVSEGDSHIDIFNAEGEYQNRLSGTPSGVFSFLSGVTVDGEGDIYASDSNGGVVDVFTPTLVTLPDATTGEALTVGHTTATVIGSVTPDGIDANCFVEYNGNTVPCVPQDVGSGTSEVQVTASLTGLLPRSTTYSYRVCGVNINAIPNCGQTKSFTTLPDHPAIVSEAVNFVTAREAVLSGVVNPETGNTVYHFAYGPSTAYGLRLPSVDLPLGTGQVPLLVQGMSVSGLQPGTTYHYAIVATNAAGTIYGPDQSFTTAPPPVPAVVTGVASSVLQESAAVSGAVNPGGTPTVYEFDLGTDTSYGTRVFGNAGSGVAGETVSAGFASLAPDTTYHYRLVARNGFGTVYGADATFTTSGFPTSVLSAPGTLGLIAVPDMRFPATASPS